MIWRLAASVALGAALAFGAGFAWQSREVAALRAESAALRAEVQGYEMEAQQLRLARAIAENQRRAAQERARQFERATEALLTGDFENADLVLDPRIGAWLECLRGGDEDCDRLAPDPAGASGARPGE